MSLPDAISGEKIELENALKFATSPISDSGSSSVTQSSESSQVVLCGEPGNTDLPVTGEMEESSHINGGKEYYCGFGKCKPKWLQVFRNAKFFTFLMCLNSLIEGAIVSGFTSVVLSSIERRYGFSSVVAGLIASVFDMSVLVSVLFISYFGGRGHKPRWLGISLIIQGTGAFVFSLPQFIFGHYEAGMEENELCQRNESEAESDCSDANNFALVFFFLGNILIGIGAAPLFTIGTSYLDDIVSPKYVSIYLGIFYTCTVVGPALGFGLGGLFLSVYVDPWRETNLEPKDSLWVGAWWMCFVFSGVLSLLISVPFLMFPKLLPNSSTVKAERVKEMAQRYDGKDGGMEEVDLATQVKSFPRHLCQVLKTPSWIFITIAICSSGIVVSGVTSFAPKYFESQFSLTASTASLVAGGVAIPGGGAGVFIGALIIYFTKSKGRNVALINWVVTLIALVPTFVFILHCPTLELVGVTVDYPNTPGSKVPSSTSRLNASCIASCDCSSARFKPVCGLVDGNTYFSPCAAGCTENSTSPNGPLFHNCSCIDRNLTINASEDFDNLTSASDGQCNRAICGMLWIFLPVLFIDLVLIFILQVPNIIITVRCVAEEQRTLALGAQSVAFRAFGSIPGPIVFGALFDSACIYWQYECSRRGNCWVYNNTHLSQRAVSVALSGIAVNFVFSFLSWWFYPKTPVPETSVYAKEDDTPDWSHDGSDSSAEHSKGSTSRPTKRSSQRMDSHCSQDVLLDSEM